jgi:hypothetical protein
MQPLMLGAYSSKAVPVDYTGCVQYPNGNKQWFVKGKLSRKDGPVTEAVNGYKEWILDSCFFTNDRLLRLKGNYIVVERGIPTNNDFGNLKLTKAKLLTAEGIVFVYDSLPGIEV